MGGLLTRRIGPVQVWVWFVMLVFGLVIYLRFRASKQPAKTDKSANILNAPNLTTAPSTLVPWTQDIFVNISQPTNGGTPQSPPPRQRPPATGIPMPGRRPLPGEWPPTPTRPTTPPPATPSLPPVVQQPPPRRESVTYAVTSGDTLWAIGQRFGIDWNAIYAANQATIEAIARQHGFSSSGGGHWIFPGEQLLIPS